MFLFRSAKLVSMHWLWRYLVAMTAGSACGLAGFGLYELLTHMTTSFRFFIGGMRAQFGQAGIVVLFGLLIPMTAAVAVYGLLTWRWGPRAADDNEVRCRKCRHILRGLTLPRCPECGEPI